MMKNGIVILLCALILLLCACTGQQSNETTPPVSTTPSASSAPVPSATATATADSAEFTMAQSCIDKSVEELYALVGQPISSDYASSCLGDGDDGNLYYDGFIVYTYREGTNETVRYVEKIES